MGETTGIQWCHATFNTHIGCAKVSPACDNCYAERDSKRLEASLTNQGKIALPLWGEHGARHVTSDEYWKKPLAWNRKAAAAGERRRVFCASFADVFEVRADLDPVRERLARLIEATPNLDWLLLTKRIDKATAYGREMFRGLAFPANVWMGTTVEDEPRARERVPALRAVPARVHFLSIEPQIELVTPELDGIDWVICGGESGPRARIFDLAWARSLREQCRNAGVAFFMKQLGARPIDGLAGCEVWQRDRHGGDPTEWPEELQVREVPS